MLLELCVFIWCRQCNFFITILLIYRRGRATISMIKCTYFTQVLLVQTHLRNWMQSYYMNILIYESKQQIERIRAVPSNRTLAVSLHLYKLCRITTFQYMRETLRGHTKKQSQTVRVFYPKSGRNRTNRITETSSVSAVLDCSEQPGLFDLASV